jgi:hypothetical protein
VSIEASPLAPGYGFGLGQQTLWTHTFSLAGAVACADHLAFTGSTPQQLGWIAAILVVAGLLINRLRMRFRHRVS